ncbi:MAG: FtsX-like permease family protein [Bacteroidetes bacterium]|jgi:ABC-type antimicrobial peptide transport system permease subunit|nr:FtsX-like permease family protein [Bacteroidota bacterium]
MLKNYFKIAWVTLFRNKVFSLINILGLSTGMTCAIFIFLWVNDELAFNKDQKNYDNIYQVYANRTFNNAITTDQQIVFPLAKELESAYPQVKKAVVVSNNWSHMLFYNDKKLNKRGLAVTEHFFDIFTCRFIKGDPQTALRDPNSLVLTESTALALFGTEDPIGKAIRIDKDLVSSQTIIPAKVTGVVADPPKNSSFDFEYLETFSSELYNNAIKDWDRPYWFVYLQTVPDADIAVLNKDINAILKTHNPKDKISNYFTFPMSKWHLESEFKDGFNTGGAIEYVRLFSIIAIVILIIACINFMNLSTARSEKKSREVGVRKTLGSSKKQLIIQFFCESMLLTLIAFFISIIAVYFLLPSFNLFVDKNLQIEISRPYFWIGMFSILLFTGLISGSYPALYLSSFKPVAVLKGIYISGKKALLPRRILVTAQFIISIMLICVTIIVYQQLQFVKGRDIGYNAENLVTITASPDLNRNFEIVKAELLKTGMVEAVTRSSSPLTDIWWSNVPSPEWKGKAQDLTIEFTGLGVDVDFTRTTGLKIIMGRDFVQMPSDSNAIMFNKTAVKAMGLNDPIGMEMWYGPEKYKIVGVVEDMVMQSPYSPVNPMLIAFNGRSAKCIDLRLKGKQDTHTAMKMVEKIINRYNPVYPFEYQFANDEFNKKFLNEELISRLATIFSVLAIFICCIGMGALTAFTIEKRTKEISVRKVLGASLPQLVLLISNEFIKLVSLAFAISVPITWILMSKWLRKYPFHTNISVWIFVVVGILILVLTFVIVFFNTIKTANTNPVKSLRTE